MHTERYRVPEIDDAGLPSRQTRVVAVGTTAVRALESAAARGELAGRTDIFIHRGFDWQVVDVLMTNFHLPKTTLLMMIDAFVGDRWRRSVRRRARAATTGSSPSATRCSSTDEPPERPLASGAMHRVELAIDGVDGAARAGTATTARGTYTTPLFMPVGTRGTIKYLSADDYDRVGAQIVLGNTYHLMLRPGADLVERFGGLGRFAGWDGLTLTDSGGFQVFSLDPKVDDDGVTFKSIYDGSSHRFTPGDRGRRRSSRSAPTSRWCSTSARRCRANPT